MTAGSGAAGNLEDLCMDHYARRCHWSASASALSDAPRRHAHGIVSCPCGAALPWPLPPASQVLRHRLFARRAGVRSLSPPIRWTTTASAPRNTTSSANTARRGGRKQAADDRADREPDQRRGRQEPEARAAHVGGNHARRPRYRRRSCRRRWRGRRTAWPGTATACCAPRHRSRRRPRRRAQARRDQLRRGVPLQAARAQK